MSKEICLHVHISSSIPRPIRAGIETNDRKFSKHSNFRPAHLEILYWICKDRGTVRRTQLCCETSLNRFSLTMKSVVKKLLAAHPEAVPRPYVNRHFLYVIRDLFPRSERQNSEHGMICTFCNKLE
jgi:hypothetical protein